MNPPPPYVLIPVGTAFLYAVAAMLLKRALHPGVGPWRTVFVANWVAAVLALPLLFLNDHPATPGAIGIAAIPGLSFLCGQIFTFVALNRGDVSVATPVLGSKVLFVAALSLVLTSDAVPLAWWCAAGLTATATVLLAGGRESGSRRRLWISIGYGFAAAASFALTDVLVQRWGGKVGPTLFLPVLFLSVAVYSFAIVPFFRGRLAEIPADLRGWLVAGSAVLGLQGLGMGVALSSYGHATVINVVYSSRGLWSVVLVFFAGHWFGNEERAQGRGVMVRRAVGSLLLVAAIRLVV